MTAPNEPDAPEPEEPGNLPPQELAPVEPPLADEPLTGEVLPPGPPPAQAQAYTYRSASFTYESRGRPGGITLLGVLFIILGLFSLLWGLLVLGVGGFSWLTGALFGADQFAAFGSNSAIQAFFGILGGILQLVVAFGLLALKKWAWLLAFIAIGASVIQGIMGMFSGGGFLGICCGAVGLIIPVWIVVYLLRKDVRAAFGR